MTNQNALMSFFELLFGKKRKKEELGFESWRNLNAADMQRRRLFADHMNKIRSQNGPKNYSVVGKATPEPGEDMVNINPIGAGVTSKQGL